MFPEGNYTAAAAETDQHGNPQADAANTAPFTVRLTSAAATNVPGNKIFNTVNSSGGNFTLSGTCNDTETVTPKFLTSGGGAWPNGGSQVTCSTTCSAGTWSCQVTFPTTTASSLQLVVSEVDSNSVSAPDSTPITGITVDMQPPSNATITVTPTAILSTSVNNPPAISGAAETGAAVVPTVTGTTRTTNHAVTAVCTAPGATITASGSAWACTAWSVTDTTTSAVTTFFPEGNYSAQVTQTDANGNPQSSATTPVAFTVRTTAAAITDMPASNIFNTVNSSSNNFTLSGTCNTFH
jgi:hypothetical protein